MQARAAAPIPRDQSGSRSGGRASPSNTARRHLRAIELSGPDVPPPPASLVQRLALYAFEVLEGTRVVTQLGGWITLEVAETLRARRALRVERETAMRDRRRRIAMPGRAHLSSPLPHVIEATVLLHVEPRATVVALRLEHHRDRWRATDITVL